MSEHYHISDRMRRGMDLSITHQEALMWLHQTISKMPPPVRVAEIGCWVGGGTLVLSDAVEKSGGGKVFAIDNWLKLDGKEGPRTIFEEMRKDFFDNCGDEIDGQVIVCDTRGSPLATDRFPDGWLDLVFIDGMHTYDAVCKDITAWDKKVRNDGVICGHDYAGESEGVGKAVRDMYVNAFEVGPGDLWIVKKHS